jgi:uncharacterized protein YbjT (DUF2867 family)
MIIAIAGGTGAVGRRVVDVARERAHDVRILTRGTGVDVRIGVGLADALVGVDAVIDVLSVSTMQARESVDFFGSTTRSLLAAETAAGVGHHLALSIVGIDRAPFDYYAGKVEQERAVEAGGVPWSILRATQFHEFAEQMLERAKVGPLRLAPRFRMQPVAARTVAERLVEIAESAPIGRAIDLAGPREEWLPDMVRAVARARGIRGPIPPVSLPGPFGRAQRDGSLLPGLGAEPAGPTFARWLAAEEG